MTRDRARRGAMLITIVAIAATGAPTDAARPPTAAPTVLMSFTGAVHGYLDVCGCAKFPLGSLARRATQMHSFQRRWPGAAALAVDAGDFSD
ncbi:MAG: hypothetical protein MUE47_01955, partial [Acidobacteria bacterium]|nr:hypothetical protein [Acidobacteriota bacterium]